MKASGSILVMFALSIVLIDGDGARSIEGAIYALRVKVNGNGFTMTGTGGGAATKAVALVE